MLPCRVYAAAAAPRPSAMPLALRLLLRHAIYAAMPLRYAALPPIIATPPPIRRHYALRRHTLPPLLPITLLRHDFSFSRFADALRAYLLSLPPCHFRRCRCRLAAAADAAIAIRCRRAYCWRYAFSFSPPCRRRRCRRLAEFIIFRRFRCSLFDYASFRFRYFSCRFRLSPPMLLPRHYASAYYAMIFALFFFSCLLRCYALRERCRCCHIAACDDACLPPLRRHCWPSALPPRHAAALPPDATPLPPMPPPAADDATLMPLFAMLIDAAIFAIIASAMPDAAAFVSPPERHFFRRFSLPRFDYAAYDAAMPFSLPPATTPMLFAIA